MAASVHLAGTSVTMGGVGSPVITRSRHQHQPGPRQEDAVCGLVQAGIPEKNQPGQMTEEMTVWVSYSQKQVML